MLRISLLGIQNSEHTVFLVDSEIQHKLQLDTSAKLCATVNLDVLSTVKRKEYCMKYVNPYV